MTTQFGALFTGFLSLRTELNQPLMNIFLVKAKRVAYIPPSVSASVGFTLQII
jgi:hypothetical protein